MRYPLFLDVQNQPVLVVGAGRVGTRKIKKLIAARARVTVVSPDATKFVRKSAKNRKISWKKRPFRSADVKNFRLVFAATDDFSVNRAVISAAKRAKIFVNSATDPERGDFFVPAIARLGKISVAISTDGVSPALAKQLRRALEQHFRNKYPSKVRKK
jgi:precorrin-2 dehydrogenase/sirohydrochlorin ferrochelatase